MFIIEDNPNSIASENYRILRTNIEYLSFDKKLKTIVITSSEPGEGKTITSGNLALSLVQDGKRVILIDCDLRRPNIHRSFKVSNKHGLSELLIGKTSLEEVKMTITKNLDVVTSGNLPPNPSEMIGSKSMEELIDNLKDYYDYIILDTPPVLAVTDAQILTTKADGTILVVRAGKTKKDNVISAKNLLNKVGVKLIGVVLNGTEIRSKGYCYEKEKSNKQSKKKLKLSFGNSN